MYTVDQLNEQLIALAFSEDIGDGDHTTLCCIPDDAMGQSRLLIKEEGILAGVRVAREVFRKFDPVTRMIIDRDSGLLNDYFTIAKGQLIDLYYFCTIGETENDEVETFKCKMENGTVEVLTKPEMDKFKVEWVPRVEGTEVIFYQREVALL